MAYQGVNQPKPTGLPIDLYREQVCFTGLNAYNGGTPGDADDFRFNSTISGIPARSSHVQDVTAYPLGSVVTDNWIEHLRGKQGQKNDTNSQV